MFLKPLATINLPQSLTFLVNFCIGISEIIFGQLLVIFSGHTGHDQRSTKRGGAFRSFLMGQPRPLFAYFRSFQTQMLQEKL